MGEYATIWTVRLAVACYLGRYLPEAACEPGERRRRVVRWLWSAGCLLLAIHVACAFAFFHDWSHLRAYAHTAAATRDVVGWNWGGGLYFNYLFTLVWSADAVRLWSRRQPRARRTPLDWAIELFLAFIVFNATVVFGPPFWRAIGVAYALLLGAAAWSRRR